MQPDEQAGRAGHYTRGRFLRTAAAGGAVFAGGVAIGSRGDDLTSHAAADRTTDAKILNVMLMLEYAQEGFYRQALDKAGLQGDLLDYAKAVVEQEAQHAAFLEKQLGARAEARSRSTPGDAVGNPERFAEAAIDLEEAAISVYIGQAANLTRGMAGRVATLVSVEARQVAWLRDIAGVPPAPRAADPGRQADTVIDELRRKGLLA